MAKKGQPAAAGDAKANAPKTRCEEGGDEIVPVLLRVSKDDRLDWTMFVCKANADVRLFRRELPGTAHDIVLHDSGQDELTARLDPLPPGDYLFRWVALAPVDEWQTRTELKINTKTTIFRLRQIATADKPMSGTGFVLVQVS
jgi:hypothetical protein